MAVGMLSPSAERDFVLARQLEDSKLRPEIHNPFFRSLWFVHLIFLSEVSSCPPYWRLSAVPFFHLLFLTLSLPK